MPPLSVPLRSSSRLDAHALAFKNPRTPAVQPGTIAGGSFTISGRRRVASNGTRIFVLDRVAAGPGNVLATADRGATWGVSFAVPGGGLPVCLEAVWSANGAQPGVNIILGDSGSGGGLRRYTAFTNAWAAVGPLVGVTYSDVAVADPRGRGLVTIDPYVVSAQTILAVGGSGGTGVIARSTDNGATWANVAGLPAVNTLAAVCKGPNFWIASCITAAPDTGSILKSVDDGATWTAQHNVQVTPEAYTYDPSSGFFVGINRNKLYESADGITWNRIYTFDPAGYQAGSANLTGIAFDHLNTWVVTTARGSILLSTDRVAWRELVLPELTNSETSDMRTIALGSPWYENIGDAAWSRNNNLLYLLQDGAGAPKLYMGSGVLDYA